MFCAFDSELDDNVNAGAANVHTAYRVVADVIVKVLAAAREVPEHASPAAGCVVHQPPNV